MPPRQRKCAASPPAPATRKLHPQPRSNIHAALQPKPTTAAAAAAAAAGPDAQPAVTLDTTAFPRIMDAIIRHAAHPTLLALRRTSRDMRERVDREMARHLVLHSHGICTPEGRAPAFAPPAAYRAGGPRNSSAAAWSPYFVISTSTVAATRFAHLTVTRIDISAYHRTLFSETRILDIHGHADESRTGPWPKLELVRLQTVIEENSAIALHWRPIVFQGPYAMRDEVKRRSTGPLSARPPKVVLNVPWTRRTVRCEVFSSPTVYAAIFGPQPADLELCGTSRQWNIRRSQEFPYDPAWELLTSYARAYLTEPSANRTLMLVGYRWPRPPWEEGAPSAPEEVAPCLRRWIEAVRWFRNYEGSVEDIVQSVKILSRDEYEAKVGRAQFLLETRVAIPW